MLFILIFDCNIYYRALHRPVLNKYLLNERLLYEVNEVLPTRSP